MKGRHPWRIWLVAGIALVALVTSASAAEVASYRFDLADLSGPLDLPAPRVRADRASDEVIVARVNDIRVYNASGMETYRFRSADELGAVEDLVTDGNGDFLLLSREQGRAGLATVVTRCDYRGTPIARIERIDWPAEFDDLAADRLFLHDGHLVFVDRGRGIAVETDLEGRFTGSWDLAATLGFDDRRDTVQIAGVSIDRYGRFLVTVPVLFQAFVIDRDGEVVGFGTKGSGPGKFGLVQGITGDDQGRMYVADSVRGFILVFDADYRFVGEFRGTGDRRIRGPLEATVGNGGRVYVRQRSAMGVPVFEMRAAPGATR